jgi:hypothetical protein
VRTKNPSRSSKSGSGTPASLQSWIIFCVPDPSFSM